VDVHNTITLIGVSVAQLSGDDFQFFH